MKLIRCDLCISFLYNTIVRLTRS